jgi:hypothetical protein
MIFNSVQTLIEKYLQDNWSANTVVFENQPINTELFDDWTRCTVQFGDIIRKTLSGDLYRVPGVLLLGFYVRPATGVARAMSLLDSMVPLFQNKALAPDTPDGTPTIYFLDASISKNLVERTGWVSTQLAHTFYFDYLPEV